MVRDLVKLGKASNRRVSDYFFKFNKSIEIITRKVSFSLKNNYLRLVGIVSNQVLMVKHLKIWTQLIVVVMP